MPCSVQRVYPGVSHDEALPLREERCVLEVIELCEDLRRVFGVVLIDGPSDPVEN